MPALLCWPRCTRTHVSAQLHVLITLTHTYTPLQDLCFNLCLARYDERVALWRISFRHILPSYLTSWFIVDLVHHPCRFQCCLLYYIYQTNLCCVAAVQVSVIPFDLLGLLKGASGLRRVQILRIVRLLRLFRLIRLLKVTRWGAAVPPCVCMTA